MTEFTNKFLIAMPHMTDPNFAKTLVFIFDHFEDGATGVIVNKTMTSIVASNILTQTGLDQLKPKPEIYFGGPVSQNRGLFLHGPDYKINSTVSLTETIQLTSDPAIIDDILEGTGPNHYHCTFGYSGWGPAQLEREFENGDWLIMPADDEIIFKIPNHEKWQTAARVFGIDIQDISGHTGFA